MSEESKPWRARLADAIEFPEDTFGGVSSITILGNTSLTVDDCAGVISYTETEARLKLCGLTLVIKGRALILHTFFDRKIKVSGTITAMEFI